MRRCIPVSLAAIDYHNGFEEEVEPIYTEVDHHVYVVTRLVERMLWRIFRH